MGKVFSMVAKAMTAAMLAGYGLYALAGSADSPAGSGVTRDEWVRVLVSAAVAGFGVWLVPNGDGKQDDGGDAPVPPAA